MIYIHFWVMNYYPTYELLHNVMHQRDAPTWFTNVIHQRDTPTWYTNVIHQCDILMRCPIRCPMWFKRWCTNVFRQYNAPMKYPMWCTNVMHQCDKQQSSNNYTTPQSGGAMTPSKGRTNPPHRREGIPTLLFIYWINSGVDFKYKTAFTHFYINSYLVLALYTTVR